MVRIYHEVPLSYQYKLHQYAVQSIRKKTHYTLEVPYSGHHIMGSKQY